MSPFMKTHVHFILRWSFCTSTPAWEDWLVFLEQQTKEKGFLPCAFVLMGNHFHLLCQGLPKQASWWDELGMELCFSEVIHPKYALHTYRYIFQNPLRAHLCIKVEDYPYHSLYSESLPEKLRRSVRLGRARVLPYHLQSKQAELSWLNGKQSLYLPNSYSRISS